MVPETELRLHQEDLKMSRELQVRSDQRSLLILAEIKALCGPPPVLSTENVGAYDTIMVRIIESLGPQDFMERLDVKHLTDTTWEIIRYTRQTPLLIERKYRQHLERRVQRIKAAAQDKPAQSADAMRAALKEIEAMMLQSPTELDHADALESGIEYAERIDKLRNAAIARRDHILQQYFEYREARVGIRFTTITGCESGLHGRRMEDCFKDSRAVDVRNSEAKQVEASPASSDPEVKQGEVPPASPGPEIKQDEASPASSNSEAKQVDTPLAASDKA
jgi:hypothetical protein